MDINSPEFAKGLISIIDTRITHILKNATDGKGSVKLTSDATGVVDTVIPLKVFINNSDTSVYVQNPRNYMLLPNDMVIVRMPNWKSDSTMYIDRVVRGQCEVSIKTQYSPDTAVWHDPPWQPNDIYMRQSNDMGYTWSGAIRIVGETGPEGPQGLPGEYYAPLWVQETYIDLSKVASPKIIAGNAYLHDALIVGADGDNMAGISGVGVTGGDVRFWAGTSYENRDDAPFKVTQNGMARVTGNLEVKASIDGYKLGEFTQNASGGLLYLYDVNGYVNAKLGVEAGQSPATNRGGAFILYDDMPAGLTDANDILKYQRCEAGTQSTGSDNYSYGTYSLRHGYRVLGDASQSKSAITVQINAGYGSKGYGQIYLWDRIDSTNDVNSKVLISAGHPDDGYYGGFVSLRNNSGQTRVDLGVNSSDSGRLLLYTTGITLSTQIQDDVVYFKNANVGIKTNNPLFPLHVEGQSKFNASIGVGMDPQSGYDIACNGSIATFGDIVAIGAILTRTGFVTDEGSGQTGIFTSADGKTITVSGGIIVGIN